MNNILVSSWFNLHSSVPLSYIQPPESRPDTISVLSSKTIPVVDLEGHVYDETLINILKASEEYGFFQVINHGVSKELMDDTMNIFKEFHAMPEVEKISESSKDPNGSCKLYTSREINNKDCIQYWRDTLRHFCPPSGEFMEFWPQKPTRYREVVEKYTKEMRALGHKILEMLYEGLGLDPKYCTDGLGESPLLLCHYYPPCPEPSLTLGSPKHRDPSLITFLYQEKDINALQVFTDGKWIVVEPIPYAFVVNIGLVLQVYPLLAAMTFVTSMCAFQLTRNLLQNPDVRISKRRRAMAVLDNKEEGEKYAEHGLRKFLRTRPPEVMPAINHFFSEHK